MAGDDNSEQIVAKHELSIRERLVTSEGTREYAKERIRANFARLEEKKGEGWFTIQTSEGEKNVREEAERVLCEMVDKYNEICKKGGMVGEKEYLPLDNSVPAHNERHSNIQTALAADVASGLAVSDQMDLPSEVGDEFSFSGWMNLTTTALLHESGYLKESGIGEIELPCVFRAGKHEDEGKVFAVEFINAENLELIGVSVEAVKNGIEGTKMAREPKRLERWSDITLSDLSHFVDLASYAVDPEQVPEGMMGLWMEMQFSKEGTAVYEKDGVSFLTMGFMEPKGNNFGQEVADLVKKLPEDLPWKVLYERNQDRIKTYKECRDAGKAGDTRLAETSCDPGFLWSLAKEFGLEKAYRSVATKLIEQKTGKELTIAEKLPTWMYRILFTEVPAERKGEFLEKVYGRVLEQMREQGTKPEGIVLQITPMAVEQEVDEKTVTMRDYGLYMDSFKKAKEKAGVEEAKLEVMLRRGDGVKVNGKIVEAARGCGIDSFVLGGFEPLDEADYELIREIHKEREVGGKKQEGGSVAIVWGQENASSFAEQGQRIRSEWTRIEPLLEEGDRIVYPTAPLKDYEEEERGMWSAAEKGVQVELSVSGALDTGYEMSDVVEFIRKCPRKEMLKLVSGNSSVWNELTTDIFKLVADGGMTKKELSELGINFG